MNAQVDVLGYLDAEIASHRSLSADAYHVQQLPKVEAIRAAVAELSEAAKDSVAVGVAGALEGSVLQEFWASKYGCDPSPAKIKRAARARLVAALARCGASA